MGVFSVACEAESERCRAARSQAADAWKAVEEKAAATRHRGAPGFEDLGAAEQAQHVKAFIEIEKQSKMVFQSFAFEKITWGTAEPARKAANETLDGFARKDDYRSFATTLESANQRFDAAQSACR